MRLPIASGAAMAAIVLAIGSAAQAAPTAQQEIASAQYLVGTWDCAHTVGSFSGTYVTTFSDILGGLWLKQTYEFPAGQIVKSGGPVHAEYFMGYDERHGGWVRFGAMSTGQYFAMRMADTSGGGWSWKYISFFKPVGFDTSAGDATFTKVSDSEYRVDGPTYPENGTGPLVTEHHHCTKQP